MEKENNKKNNLIPIIIIALVAVIGIVIALVLILNQKEDTSYRDIKVLEIDGLATINREGIGDIEAYVNMGLESGDYVTINQGRMTLKLDEDKYIYVEEGTELQLLAVGNSVDSKTTINLMKGEITNAIEQKLSETSVYEVCTPTATMSVRGTVFHVKVYEKDGIFYTDVNVLEGVVETTLTKVDGRDVPDKDGIMVPAGYKVTVYDDDEVIDYLMEMTEIDPDELPEDIRAMIDDLIEDDTIKEKIKLAVKNKVGGEEGQEEAPGPFTVNFLYNGQLFGSQIVDKGGYATEPSLMPAPSGSWDYDFATPVISDTDIKWIE